jgi:AcrR family transcriptional regulator
MARPKKQFNRRNNIIEAAQNLFIKQGFEKTTMDEIAKHAGISKGSIYLEFKNKDEINLVITRKHAMFLIEQFEFEAKQIKKPYLEELKQIIIKDLLNIFDMVILKMHSYITLIHTSYQIKLELKDMISRKYDIISSILEKAANNNEINPCDNYDELSHLICVSVQGFLPPYDLKYSHHHRTDISKEELRGLLSKDLSVFMEIIFSGIKTQNIYKSDSLN